MKNLFHLPFHHEAKTEQLTPSEAVPTQDLSLQETPSTHSPSTTPQAGAFFISNSSRRAVLRGGLRAVGGAAFLLAMGAGTVEKVDAAGSSTAEYIWPTGGWFSETGVEGVSGYAVTDKFFGLYESLGGANVLGYPLSFPFTIAGNPKYEGFTYQWLQKGLLQQNAQTGETTLANYMDMLHDLGYDQQLELKGIPAMDTTPDGSTSFEQAKTIRLAWLDNYPNIKTFYYNLAKGGDPVQVLGLPTAHVQQVSGYPFQCARCQRGVIGEYLEGPKKGVVELLDPAEIAVNDFKIVAVDARTPLPYGGGGAANETYPVFNLPQQIAANNAEQPAEVAVPSESTIAAELGNSQYAHLLLAPISADVRDRYVSNMQKGYLRVFDDNGEFVEDQGIFEGANLASNGQVLIKMDSDSNPIPLAPAGDNPLALYVNGGTAFVTLITDPKVLNDIISYCVQKGDPFAVYRNRDGSKMSNANPGGSTFPATSQMIIIFR